MNSKKGPYYVAISVLALLILFPGSYAQTKGPQPGDVYKEYIVNLKIADNWRVTDPNAGNSGALEFLPNPVLTIAIDDLEGAVRAEALMDIWGGHTGTTGRRVRFNGNDWIDLPEHPSIKANPECYNSEFNYITAVPLEYLHEGENTFEGTSGGQTCFNFNWGQWGWYIMLIRIYYGPEKAHPTGMITSHPTGSDIVEMDTIEVNASGTAMIKKVDLLARYYGYDENGDGIYFDWHRNYHSVVLAKHVGTAVSAPYRFVWDNRWIPDQDTGSVSFLARIQDINGVWYVTDAADSLTLVRPERVSVKMYTAESVPQKFWVRAGEKKYCYVTIGDLAGATDAILMHRTWNGTDGGAGSGTVPLPLSVNAWNGKVGGVSHNYYLSVVNVPLDALVEGSNTIGYHSQTVEHGIEILWPGPAILVRYNEHAGTVATPSINPEGGEYEMPLQVSINCETPGASIYYTTTGPDPNLGSRKYTGPITLNDTSIVKAIANRFDYFPSEIAIREFYAYKPPQLLEAYKGPNPNTIMVRFSKPVEKSTAENSQNYSLDKDGIIVSAAQDTGRTEWVTLTVSGLVYGDEYTLTVNNVVDNKGTPVPVNAEVPYINEYVIMITASGADRANIPENTMDRNPDTYWSAQGTTDVWIQYDMGTTRQVQSVDIAFFLGDQRNSYFSIETSLDGTNWSEVYSGESSGNSLDLEHFDVDDNMARYIRILGMGNSSGNNWNSYTEVQINWFWETGVPDQQQTGFHIYPVPAVDGIHVELPSCWEDPDIYLVNATGQTSAALHLDKSSVIPTRHLDSGMYLLVIKADDWILRQKILVIND